MATSASPQPSAIDVGQIPNIKYVFAQTALLIAALHILFPPFL